MVGSHRDVSGAFGQKTSKVGYLLDFKEREI